MIDYTILILCVFVAASMLATAKCLVNINKIDKRIDILEKRELIRQLEQRRDKAYIEAKDLFKDW